MIIDIGAASQYWYFYYDHKDATHTPKVSKKDSKYTIKGLKIVPTKPPVIDIDNRIKNVCHLSKTLISLTILSSFFLVIIVLWILLLTSLVIITYVNNPKKRIK